MHPFFHTCFHRISSRSLPLYHSTTLYSPPSKLQAPSFKPHPPRPAYKCQQDARSPTCFPRSCKRTKHPTRGRGRGTNERNVWPDRQIILNSHPTKHTEFPDDRTDSASNAYYYPHTKPKQSLCSFKRKKTLFHYPFTKWLYLSDASRVCLSQFVVHLTASETLPYLSSAGSILVLSLQQRLDPCPISPAQARSLPYLFSAGSILAVPAP